MPPAPRGSTVSPACDDVRTNVSVRLDSLPLPFAPTLSANHDPLGSVPGAPVFSWMHSGNMHDIGGKMLFFAASHALCVLYGDEGEMSE